MAKEWILNSATNRFQLNFKRNVGAVSEEIRKCSPKTISEWQDYYFKNVRTKNQITELGKKLYIKITEVLVSEIDEITEKDCIDYIYNLVIERTFDGYTTEIKTVYGQLEKLLNIKIFPAPDKWDRLYNVDFYIEVNKNMIGLQIKPVSNTASITEIFKERQIQEKTHIKFHKEFGGKVFYIFSVKQGNTKTIANLDIINDIKAEIARLSK